jgi:dihydroneopterin aldolase
MPILEFRSARLSVHLGCSADERAHPQDVDLDVAIRFGAPPVGCETDELEDTICYAGLIKAAREVCQKREFRLIEKLAREIYHRLRCEVPAGSDLWLNVTKLHPPVPGLQGGVSFSFGDWQRSG